MSLLLKAFPLGRPLRRPRTTHARSGPRAASVAVVVALGVSLLPGLAATPATAAPALAPAAVPAAVPAPSALSGPVATASPCARKKRASVRKACFRAERAAARARAVAVARARAATLAAARTYRARYLASARAATYYRAAAAPYTRKACLAKKRASVERQCFRTMERRHRERKRANAALATATRQFVAARGRAVSAVGRPPSRTLVPAGNYFSYPNRSTAEQRAIRSRVIASINSTWGGPRDGSLAWAGNGTIRMVTWTFNDWAIAKALYAAKQRGVSVQIVAAKAPNKGHAPWRWLKKKLGNRSYYRSVPGSSELTSFARECRGSCRGPGGTPHAKYFLFDRTGPAQTRNVVVQTSMNLTDMGYEGQWNNAQVMHSSAVYTDFLRVFQQVRLARGRVTAYHQAALGNVVTYFFPRPRATQAQDPVMQVLNGVRCQGSTAPGTAGRTRIRIIQYSMSGRRGVWIAKKLRLLKRAGCDVRMIYADSSSPVMKVMRAKRAPGPIPMKQSVLVDGRGLVKAYNHSKWMTVYGAWGGRTSDALTLSGSANWSDAAFSNDEQMTLTRDLGTVRSHMATFDKTWGQRSSRPVSRAARWPSAADAV